MTKEQATARLETLAAKVSRHVGQPVEITIRGPRSFTFSTQTNCPALMTRVCGEMPTPMFDATLEHAIDQEDGDLGSFCYVEVRAA